MTAVYLWTVAIVLAMASNAIVAQVRHAWQPLCPHCGEQNPYSKRVVFVLIILTIQVARAILWPVSLPLEVWLQHINNS